MIIDAFKNKIFPLVPSGYTSDDDNGLRPDSPTFSTTDKSDESDFNDTEKYLDPDPIEKYFFNMSLKKISDFLKHKKDTFYGKTEVGLINNKLKDLKTDIKYMPGNEVKNKKLDLLAGLVEKILNFNELLNIPDLKSEKSATERQKGQGLKILTPQQMITRLPILLAQLKEGNNSQKLKNEIRQIVY